MIWILLSLLVALSQSIKDVIGKKILRNINEYIVSWSYWFFAIPVLLIGVLITGIPETNLTFWGALFGAATTGVIGSLFYMKAIKESDLSITIPILAFTPLLMLIASPLILGEFPNTMGLIGIILIVIGSYVLNIKERSNGYLNPFKMFFKEKGSKYMMITVLIWSIGANLDKVGVQNSSPIFYSLAVSVVTSIALFVLMLIKSKENLTLVKKNVKKLAPIGLLSGISFTIQFIAISMAYVSYVVAIKRLSIIFSIMMGYYFFKEKDIRERLIGAIIMIVGVFFIALS